MPKTTSPDQQKLNRLALKTLSHLRELANRHKVRDLTVENEALGIIFSALSEACSDSAYANKDNRIKELEKHVMDLSSELKKEKGECEDLHRECRELKKQLKERTEML